MITAEKVLTLLKHQANEAHAERMQGFFKTEKGDYGEGDIFWGIRVLIQRTIAKKFGENYP